MDHHHHLNGHQALNLSKNQQQSRGNMSAGMRPSGSSSSLNKSGAGIPPPNPASLLPPQFDLLAQLGSADFNAVLAAAAGGLPPNIDPTHLMAAFAQMNQLASGVGAGGSGAAPSKHNSGGTSLLQQQLTGSGGFPTQSPSSAAALAAFMPGNSNASSSSLHHSSSQHSLSNTPQSSSMGNLGGGGKQSSGARYQQLLAVIDEIGKDIRPVYMGNKNSIERLKRAIANARVLVKDCQIECDRSTKN